MCPDKPALFHVFKLPRFWAGHPLRNTLGPQRWRKCLAVFIDSYCVIGTRIIYSQIGFKKSIVGAADDRNIAEWNPEGANSIENPLKPKRDCHRVSLQPLVFRGKLLHLSV